MHVALVHDWLVAHRGGEAVLLELARMFPEAPIYTLVADRSAIHPELSSRDIRTSSIQALPGAPKRFRQYLPLFPAAVEAFDFSDFDLVLSTSHCVAKGVKTGTVPHISYVHTPMRYAWDQRGLYAPSGPAGLLARPVFEAGAAWLRRWDRGSAGRATRMVANSQYVAQRIQACWGRDADVIHPPVDTSFYSPADGPRQPYMAVVGAQVGYKNNRLAVEFATHTGRALKVIGDGPDIEKLRAAAGPSVSFEGHVSRERLREIYQNATALLFCGIEDFGIVPVEAMACGCPVIAFAQGGALETVQTTDKPITGVLFGEATVDAIAQAAAQLEILLKEGQLDRQAMHEYSRSFSPEAFRATVTRYLDSHGYTYR